MPINDDFCHGDKKPIGKISDGDGNFHWVWPSQAGEGQNEWDASKNELVKVLSTGELSDKINVVAHRFSASAKETIEAKGGSATTI